MAMTFDEGRDGIASLCQYFTTNREEFLAPAVKEAHVQQTLIDPLFEALGWDIRNLARHAPQNREVIPQASIDVEGQAQAPDYAFRLGQTTKFFAEAKKCSVNIAVDREPAHQIRRYAWNAGFAVSLLTNFVEFAVYDCTRPPRLKEKASFSRLHHLAFEEYPDRWRELWDVYSREAVWNGAFDAYVRSKRKRGTSEVDVAFLKEMEDWRLALAGNIAIRNTDISLEDLNAAVQLTIDRVVFLRMAEDRGLESERQLLRLCNGSEIYAHFMRECRRADKKYNSGLFHFETEDGVSEKPDRITPRLAIDDKVLKPILQGLYFEHGSPYDFRLLPVEILGTVYERFLGKVIRLTAGHQAKIEDKPEVRKAGGVHYTPAFVVKYIVKHTVGRQIEGRTPASLAGGKNKPPFRILDISCGSGSFLLGAYQYLLDYYLLWYTEHKPEAYKKAVYKDPRSGEWRLTVDEKKRILTTHIFGVDIDRQAVEVTKLSLLLKVLEGETEQSLHLGLLPWGDRALPNLADNIKCGNSLVGASYFAGKTLPELDMNRINPFDWAKGFPQVMKDGGFDALIGNPPYIRIQTMKEWAELEVGIYKELFEASKTGNYDMYVVFIEQGLKLLNAKGQLGFICPSKFFNSQYGRPLREMISAGGHLSHIVHFGSQQVFEEATTYTCLLFLSKASVSECLFVKVDDLVSWHAGKAAIQGIVKARKVTANNWNFSVGIGSGLFEKLSSLPHTLGDVADVFVGVQTSADAVYIMDFVAETNRTYRLRSKVLATEWVFEKDLFCPIVSGTDICRYAALPSRQYVLFPYAIQNELVTLIDFKTIERNFPKTAAYFIENKKQLEDREKGRMKGPDWHGYIYLKNMARQSFVKLCVPRLVDRLHAAFDYDGSHVLDNVDVGGITLKATFVPQGLEYVLALLNCRLMRWFFPQVSAPFRGGWWSANRQFLSLIPIRVIDFKNAKDKAAHRKLILLVASMQGLHKKIAAAKSAAHMEVVQRQIDATDAEIDRLVYDLYGLTDKEIEIVEGASRP